MVAGCVLDSRSVSFTDTSISQSVSFGDAIISATIRSFRDKRSQSVFDGICPKEFQPDLLKSARRKLRMIDAARHLADLRVPPNNNLHALVRERTVSMPFASATSFGFALSGDGDAHQVEITDYH